MIVDKEFDTYRAYCSECLKKLPPDEIITATLIFTRHDPLESKGMTLRQVCAALEFTCKQESEQEFYLESLPRGIAKSISLKSFRDIWTWLRSTGLLK